MITTCLIGMLELRCTVGTSAPAGRLGSAGAPAHAANAKAIVAATGARSPGFALSRIGISKIRFLMHEELDVMI